MPSLASIFLSQLSAPSAVEDDSVFDPMIPEVLEASPLRGYLVVAALIVLLIALWLGGRWLWKHLRNQEQVKWEALTAAGFRELQTKLDSMPGNELGIAVSDLLKRYLSEVYQDQLRYETPSEFLSRQAREESNIPAPIREQLAHFLLVSEEIKFGNLTTDHERKMAMLTQAIGIMDQVKLDQQAQKGTRQRK